MPGDGAAGAGFGVDDHDAKGESTEATSGLLGAAREQLCPREPKQVEQAQCG
ncbi:hypothetical protein PSH03_001718 [Micromonospora sp. PSH03]|uniref:hypothetical protein n=1 Tax=Micromonospora salmantinae TaxID=2911211 RepID=UPI001EE91AF6|nr:hypothetical protein [Micromonospora salmantinae]MCG5456814.1 hypothetical protein [Micromonospora salmantinae]